MQAQIFTGWELKFKLLPGPLGRTGGLFGSAVDVYGHHMVVGAPGEQSVYVYDIEAPEPLQLIQRLQPIQGQGVRTFPFTLFRRSSSAINKACQIWMYQL